MRERRQILELYRQGNAAALATLIAVEGSSYRRVGARLLVSADGEYAGGISGGCLEADVVRKAQWMVRGGPVVEEYATGFEDAVDANEMPYGLGCGGTVRVLIEPANAPEFHALMEAMERSLEGRPQRVMTELPWGRNAAKSIRRRVMDEDEKAVFSSAGAWDETVRDRFEEVLLPPQRLVIFGAGNDAQPMAAMAALLGWSITVADARAQWARQERFPQADDVLAVSSMDEIALRQGDAAIVMTHSYEQDRMWLAGVLACCPRYIGLLGARHRSALLVAEAAALAGCSMERACEAVFAPVGLDLGGDGAEVIALATIAEIQACIEGKAGQSRRLTPALIKEQLRQGDASPYLQAQCAV